MSLFMYGPYYKNSNAAIRAGTGRKNRINSRADLSFPA
jgi:hypothetical protein